MTEADPPRTHHGSVRVVSEGDSLAALDGAMGFVVDALHLGIGDVEVPGNSFLHLDVGTADLKSLIRVSSIRLGPFEVVLDLSDLVEPVLDIATGDSVYGLVRSWLGLESARRIRRAGRTDVEVLSTGHGGLRASRRDDGSPIVLQRFEEGGAEKPNEKFIPERRLEGLLKIWLDQTREGSHTKLTHRHTGSAGRSAYSFEVRSTSVPSVG